MDYNNFEEQNPLITPEQRLRMLQMTPGSQPFSQQQALGQYMYGPKFNALQGASMGDKFSRFGKNMGYGLLGGLMNTAIPGLGLGNILLGNKVKTEDKFAKKNKKKDEESPAWLRILSNFAGGL